MGGRETGDCTPMGLRPGNSACNNLILTFSLAKESNGYVCVCVCVSDLFYFLFLFFFLFFFTFFNCFSSTVISIFPSPLRPTPAIPISHTWSSPFGFVHVSFIHVPDNPSPFSPVIPSHLPSSYCPFVFNFSVSGYIFFYFFYCCSIIVVPIFPQLLSPASPTPKDQNTSLPFKRSQYLESQWSQGSGQMVLLPLPLSGPVTHLP